MSFFYSTPPEAFVEAIAAGDWDTATLLMSDASGELEDHLAAQTFVTVLGTLDGAGAATLAHGIDLTSASVVLCQGFSKGAGTQSVPLTITYVDAANVAVTGGAAGAACRVTVIFTVGLISF